MAAILQLDDIKIIDVTILVLGIMKNVKTEFCNNILNGNILLFCLS